MRVLVLHNLIAEPLDAFDRELYRRNEGDFRRILQQLSRRYRLFSLPEALACLDQGDPLTDGLVLTFDDGFAGVYDFALPILRDAGTTATIFLLTEPVVRGQNDALSEFRLFHFERLEIAFRLTQTYQLDLVDYGMGRVDLGSDCERAPEMTRIKSRLKQQPKAMSEAIQASIMDQLRVSDREITDYAEKHSKYRKLSKDQVNTLLMNGWTVGGHTRTHFPLSTLDDDVQREEVAGNLQDLVSLFGVKDPPFAYPYGNHDAVEPHAPDVVRAAGFRCAFTTYRRDCLPNDDRYRLGRYSEMDLLYSLRNH